MNGEIVQLARKGIEELKSKYPNYSSTQIASKIGMRQSTFSRIENKQANPSLNSIMKIFASLNKTYEISEVIKEFDPQLASSIKKNLQHNLETPVLGQRLAHYFSKSSYSNILLLALTQSGATREEISKKYGDHGQSKLEELLSVGILFESKGIIRGNEEKITLDQKTLKEMLVNCIQEHYNPEGFGKGETWLSLQTESVNKEKALRLIRQKLQKVYKEIKEEILYSPEYAGNDKVFVGMVADNLCEKTKDTK